MALMPKRAYRGEPSCLTNGYNMPRKINSSATGASKTAFAVLLAPVAEEFIFRGMLYPFVKQLGSPRYALFGISAIFALIHLDAGTLVPLFVLALALTWLYEKTDNLLAPITAHALFNAANLVLFFFAQNFSLPSK